jgi:hypothetical protein
MVEHTLEGIWTFDAKLELLMRTSSQMEAAVARRYRLEITVRNIN